MRVFHYFKKKSLEDILFDFVVTILCLIVFIAVAYPIYFVIIASVSDSTLVARGEVTLWPKGFSIYGYEQIFQDSRVWTGYLNTISILSGERL